MKPNTRRLAVVAYTLTALEGPAETAAHARRAFDLAHRARRLLERAAETASRDRWTALEQPRSVPARDTEQAFALECAKAAIRYPVEGEAKVYAALLDAVDCAYLASESLRQQWLATQRTHAPIAVDPGGPIRTAVPLAPGCARVDSCGYSDEENAP